MKEELNRAIEQTEKALVKLQEGANEATTELNKDGVIKRFEFTFELLWKTIKIFLRDSGVEAKSPKESLKEAFKLGWLTTEDPYLDMLEARNKTSHIYDQQTAEEIFKKIKAEYVGAIEKVVNKLKDLK